MVAWLGAALKGIGIGLSIIVPGMSGGTAAVILGIYEELIGAIKQVDLKVLAPVGVGAAVGLLGGARVVEFLFITYPFIISSFLIGLIAASSRQLLGSVKKWGFRQVAVGLTGLAGALLLSVPMWGQTDAVGSLSVVRLLVGGMVAAAAMIIPGISGASVLILLGQYRAILEAVNDLLIIPLAIFGVGAVIGLGLFSRLISYFLREHPGGTAALLGGLIVGSVRAIWPQHIGPTEVMAFIIGVALVEVFEMIAGTERG